MWVVVDVSVLARKRAYIVHKRALYRAQKSLISCAKELVGDTCMFLVIVLLESYQRALVQGDLVTPAVHPNHAVTPAVEVPQHLFLGHRRHL